MAGILLLVAHASVAIHAGRLIDYLFLSQAQRDAADVPKRSLPAVAISFILWTWIVFAVDRWIMRLPISSFRKAVLLAPAIAVLVVVIVLEIRRFVIARRRGRVQPLDTAVRLASEGDRRVDDRATTPRRLDTIWNLIAERIPRLVVSAAVGALVVVLAVAIAGYFNQRDTDDDVIAIPPIPRDARNSDEIVYVALGESYSAGEGLDSRISGADEHCHRSVDAYPMLVARALGSVYDSGDPPLEQSQLVIPDGVRLEFRACSGAVSADIDNGLIGGWPAQIDSEPRPDVDLVTITIGGNDVIFSDVVQACMLYDDCLDDDFEPRQLDRSRPTIDYPERQPLRDWAIEAITYIKPNLRRVYEGLRTTYPKARILVIGYPYLFHDEPSWRSLPDLDCWTVMNRISLDERRGLRTLTDQLNTAIKDVINEVSDQRIELVSTVAAFHQHEPCGEWGQYTNAVKPALQLLSPVDGGSFHPNVQGHRQFALTRRVRYLAQVDQPPPEGTTIQTPHGSGISEPLPDEAAMNDCSRLLTAAQP